MSKEFRVYGPPGTGKTTWIARNAEKCSDKYGPDQISICSLTNTAVKEVVGRDLSLDGEDITTLHARCKRSLSAPPPAETRVDEFIKEYPQWARPNGSNQGLPSYMLNKYADRNNLTEKVLEGGSELSLYEKAQILRQKMVPKSDWPDIVRRWHEIWDHWCEDLSIMDFTKWLEVSLEIRPLPRQQVLFIDEAQDHTPLQLSVIRSWKVESRVLVGDDDQCLYEWSGAIPEFFYGNGDKEAVEKVLERSWRVPRKVHSTAVKLINRVKSRKDKIYKPRDCEGEVARCNYFSSSPRLPPGILEDDDKTYMILSSCGYMLDEIIHSLKSRGIPFHNPYRKSNLKWNPLANIMEKINNYQIGKDRLWNGIEAQSWASILKSRDVFKKKMKKEFLSHCERISGSSLLRKDIHQYFLPHIAKMILDKDINLLKSFRMKGIAGSWDYAFKVLSKSIDEQEPRIIIGTIHSVKGGEADVVYLLPDLSPPGYSNLIWSNPDAVYRLFYVGMTRAKEKLLLCEPDGQRYSIPLEV